MRDSTGRFKRISRQMQVIRAGLDVLMKRGFFSLCTIGRTIDHNYKSYLFGLSSHTGHGRVRDFPIARDIT